MRIHRALPALLALAACRGGGDDAPPPDTSAAPIQPPIERPADATPWQVRPDSPLVLPDTAAADSGQGG